MLEQHLVEFNQLAMTHAKGSEALINRVRLYENISIAVLLELKDSSMSGAHVPSQHVLVADPHILWKPEFCDVKLIQTIILMNELNSIIMKAKGIRYKTQSLACLGNLS